MRLPLVKFPATESTTFRDDIPPDLCQNRPTPADMADLTTEQKLALLKRNLSEVLDQQIIEDVYKQGRDPVIYWGAHLQRRDGHGGEERADLTLRRHRDYWSSPYWMYVDTNTSHGSFASLTPLPQTSSPP
jgi:hypothetical protein